MSDFRSEAEDLGLNTILLSICRQEILRALTKNNKMRIMQLVKATGFSYNEVDRNVRILENQALVSQVRRRGYRIVSLNLENERLPVLLNVIGLLGIQMKKGGLQESRNLPERANDKQQVNCQLCVSAKTSLADLTKINAILRKTEKSEQFECKAKLVPDVFWLLDIPESLRKPVMALYKKEEAAMDDLQKETGLPRRELDQSLNVLLQLGAIRKKTEGENILFYIESPKRIEK
jgi:DNA-binding transcriptional regulator GbsR (MarR family)